MTHATHDGAPFSTAAATQDARRVEVRQLAGQGLSNRAIARRVGVSEATVRRWRRDDAGAARDALAVVLDDDLRDDLDVLAEAGLSADAAVALAVHLLAQGYRAAWDYGDAPRGVQPYVQVIAYGAPTPW